MGFNLVRIERTWHSIIVIAHLLPDFRKVRLAGSNHQYPAAADYLHLFRFTIRGV